MEDCLNQIWVYLWTAYTQVAPDLYKKTEEYIKITYKIYIREDKTFDKKYSKLVHQTIFESIDLNKTFQSMAL